MKITFILLSFASIPISNSATFGGCTINNNGAKPTPPAISNPGTCSDTQACGGQADIVLSMDGSGSISTASYDQAKIFLKDLAMSFAIEQDLVNIGMVQWSGSSTGTCTPSAGTPSCDASILNPFVNMELSYDLDQICSTINANQIKSGTPTLEGLLASHCVLKGGRPTASKFLVFITDGSPSAGIAPYPEIVAAANAIKADGVKLFSINVGGGSSVDTLMKAIASDPKADHYFSISDFSTLVNGNFADLFVDQVACVPTTDQPSSAPTQVPDDSRCECWFKPDLLACPIVRGLLEYECGGGTGSYFYDCTDEQHEEEEAAYVLWNILLWVYKVCFLLTLHFVCQCRTVDIGTTDILCWRLQNAHLVLLVANIFLVLMTYLFRCIAPIWAIFCFIFLHIDVVMCLINRQLQKRPVAAPKPPPPRSNLELFAYTNNKKSWKEKAFQTIELKTHKQVLKGDEGKLKKAEKLAAARKSSIKKKGFSVKGAGLI